PYTITDSLLKPAQANDPEPNNSKDQAINLTVGSTVTGHINYYYNLQRDAEDWYKLVTTKDGQITATITSANGQYIWVYLYDNDGTTQLNANYTNSSITISTDGLAAGTYYLKITSYYSTGFEPYTLSNTLDQYTNANDGISN